MSLKELWFTEITSALNNLFKEDNTLVLSFGTSQLVGSKKNALQTESTLEIIYEKDTTEIQIKIDNNLDSDHYDYLKTALIQAGVLSVDFSRVEEIIKKADVNMIVYFFLDTNMFINRCITNYFYQKARSRQLSYVVLFATPLIKGELGRIYEKNKIVTRPGIELESSSKAHLKFANALIGLKEYEIHKANGLIKHVPYYDKKKQDSLDIGDKVIYSEYTNYLRTIPNHPAYFLTMDKAYSARVSTMTPIIVRQDIRIPERVTADIRTLPSLIYTMATMFSEIKVSAKNNVWFHLSFGRNSYSYTAENAWVNLLYDEKSLYAVGAASKLKKILKDIELLRSLRKERDNIQKQVGGGYFVDEIY